MRLFCLCELSADGFCCFYFPWVRWGHFSTVWLAHEVPKDRHVALKIVKSARRYTHTARDEIAILQHIREASASPRASKHPGRDRLVTFLDAFQHPNPATGQNHFCMA